MEHNSCFHANTDIIRATGPKIVPIMPVQCATFQFPHAVASACEDLPNRSCSV